MIRLYTDAYRLQETEEKTSEIYLHEGKNCRECALGYQFCECSYMCALVNVLIPNRELWKYAENCTYYQEEEKNKK